LISDRVILFQVRDRGIFR